MSTPMYAVSPLEANRSMGASFDGNSFSVSTFDNFSVQAIITGASSLSGDLYVQGSLDGTNWFDLQTTAITSNTTVRFCSLSATEIVANVRFKWTRSSGTGTLNAIVGTVST